MRENKKGFTLIELLAVIVILAIIALIAVPVVLNLLEKSRLSAAEDTAYSVLNAAELYYAETLLDAPTEAFADTTFVMPGDIAASEAEEDKLQLKGTKPTAGSVKVNARGVATIVEPLIINGLTCSQVGTEVNCER